MKEVEKAMISNRERKLALANWLNYLNCLFIKKKKKHKDIKMKKA